MNTRVRTTYKYEKWNNTGKDWSYSLALTLDGRIHYILRIILPWPSWRSVQNSGCWFWWWSSVARVWVWSRCRGPPWPAVAGRTEPPHGWYKMPDVGVTGSSRCCCVCLLGSVATVLHTMWLCDPESWFAAFQWRRQVVMQIQKQLSMTRSTLDVLFVKTSETLNAETER